MMKILHIAQSPGGVERYISMLLSQIDRDKFENALLCSYQFDKSHFESMTSEVIMLPMKRNIGFSDVKRLSQIRKIIKQVNPDVIYCHSSKAGAIGRFAALGLHKKLVYNAHGWSFNMNGSKLMHYLYILVEFFLGLFTDRIVCISKSELNDARKLHIGSENKLRLIYNGVNIEEIQEKLKTSECDRHHLRIPQDAFVVGMVGRISEQKAVDVFVKMAHCIKQKIPNSYFIIVGDGEMRVEIEKMITDYDLDDSFFISGWVDNVSAYMKLFDVGVLLSRWEGFGLALCEYMVARLPIVTTRVDAIPELILDGVNGILVERDDYQAAAKAVVNIYNNQELRTKFAYNGINIVNEKFNIIRTVEQHEKLFEEIKS